MLIADTSLSACRKHPPTCGILLAIYSGTWFCGVIGYPKKNLQPALIAASAIASFPFINVFAILFPLLLINFTGPTGSYSANKETIFPLQRPDLGTFSHKMRRQYKRLDL